MSILIIQPVEIGPPGELLPALEMARVKYQVIKMAENEKIPANVHSYRALIIMGGTMSANDIDKYPFLTDIKKTVQLFYRADKPVLGICLGAQLIASSFKKKVGRMSKVELGMTELQKTEAAIEDPLFRLLPNTFSFMEWHEDYFDLPDEAVLLATGSFCKNQAFRIGDNIYGFQFHPEVTESILKAWVKHTGNQDPDIVEKIDKEIKLFLPQTRSNCHRLVTEWLKLISKDKSRENEYDPVTKCILQEKNTQ
ncbi:type 1 glutamine amidotransferase [Siminovitchia sediminis]|uniref:Type 1 glutamine amidotransferase n=1 Tax=Siminovitchia sediminis TaxID=1274353 RepID=A0ABW4KPX5_9BACI